MSASSRGSAPSKPASEPADSAATSLGLPRPPEVETTTVRTRAGPLPPYSTEVTPAAWSAPAGSPRALRAWAASSEETPCLPEAAVTENTSASRARVMAT